MNALEQRQESEEPQTPARRRRWRQPGWKRWSVIGGAGVLVVAAGVYAFFVRGPAPSVAGPVVVEGNDAPVLEGNVIRISDAFVQRAGVAAEPVAVQRIAPLVSVNGTLTYDPRKFAAVGARIGGRVRRIWKYVGDEVRAGAPLAEIESAELGRAESQVLAARAKEKAAEADMKRERRLADAKITAERDAELAKASYEAARAERVAAERAVEALGGDLEGELGVLVLRSPIDGRIVESKATRGQTVEPTDTLYDVADVSSLWVELRVFERDVAAVRAGDQVEITAAGGKHAGKVAYVGDVIDPETRTAVVRVLVENQDRSFRPGQSVVARVRTTAPASDVLSVTRKAVTRIDGKATVFVLRDRNTVEPRLVTTGAEDAERVAVLEGLKPGEQVVVGGMFALKSEIFR
jgi:membrane fusion protein, heavy metal efflux system